jgi:hypothetical protein
MLHYENSVKSDHFLAVSTCAGILGESSAESTLLFAGVAELPPVPLAAALSLDLLPPDWPPPVLWPQAVIINAAYKAAIIIAFFIALLGLWFLAIFCRIG